VTRSRGWTLLELSVASGLFLLLVACATMTFVSYSRTLLGLQREGDHIARGAHGLENLQRQILLSHSLPVGNYTLGAEPLRLRPLAGGTVTEVTLVAGNVTWSGRVQGVASRVALRVWRESGHSYVRVEWELPPPLPMLISAFDATVLP
jgi:hypothetical protein